ncbi:Hypothetical predicted protein [Paramuricea clavata]|uniref:Uncharacterized protein n=1 Tax=Paramuricea clavata TaxID=317549 RepID=A0A6S7IRC5_PARCT|nr:Hypothetical predicted protein [Paramuricea clavata]
MADSWAAFKTPESAKKEGSDDDWADFGGFESASPASNPFGDSSASAGFPWATAFPAVSQQQPSPPLTNAQATFPVQTTAFPTSSEQTSNASSLPQTQSGNLLLGDSGGEYATLSTAQSGAPGQMSLSQGILPTQQPPSHTALPIHPRPLKGDVPSQLTASHGGTPTQQMQHQAGILTKPNIIPSNDLFISPSREVTVQSAPPIPSREHRTTSGPVQSPVVDETRLNKVQGELKEANDQVNDYQNKLQVSEEKLSLAERETIRLEKSLEEMKKKYTEATDVAKEQYLEIERQIERYDLLQVKIYSL